jgi:hypothetical protein
MARDARKEPFLGSIQRAIRARLDHVRQAIRVSGEIKAELRLIKAASMLAGIATVYLILVFASVIS